MRECGLLEKIGWASAPPPSVWSSPRYSFNLHAFAICVALAAVFVALRTNKPKPMTDPLPIRAMSPALSKGAHEVTDSAIVVPEGTPVPSQV